MTVNATYYAGGTGYTPADMMQRDADWISPGVLSSGDLVVAQTATASMNITVSGAAQGQTGGNAWLPNGYRVFNDSLATLGISAADTTNPRIDLVVIVIDTTVNPYVPQLKVIKGTAAASPSVPALPTGFVGIALAQVRVNANATSITSANITDVRAIAGLVSQFGGEKIASSLSELNNDRIYNCGSTSGTNAYTITNSDITAYADGLTVRVKIGNSSTGASTLNINGLGAKTILDTLGNPIVSGGLKAGLPYHLCYNGTNFIVLGKGGGGDATAAQILLGKKATVDSGQVTGTLDLTNLVTGNIKSGVKINGVSGKASVVDTSDALATAAQILSGASAYVNGIKIDGTIPLMGDEEFAGWRRASLGIASVDGRIHLAIPDGYYNGAGNNGLQGVFYDDANFNAGNILNGVTIAGLTGSATIETLGGHSSASGTFVLTTGDYTVQSVTLSFVPTVVIVYYQSSWSGAKTIWASTFGGTTSSLRDTSTPGTSRATLTVNSNVVSLKLDTSQFGATYSWVAIKI
ncbi:hypothetical protein [Clostridium chromiireducens]|uniref:Uncharacterized protein n=1 Tax=Clostridium chromiireducens TaxID=225345 RepID=A0A1V4IUF2_9CLOT|nr:hypothetical protein [Clostridium chromiireducens]OPJ63671.1 hypothetical protein CLCHR_14860 [Clostridium chromiireducens]